MYNRYIGNTGKFYRIDDDELPRRDAEQFPAPTPTERVHSVSSHTTQAQNHQQPFLFSQPEIIGSLKGIIGRMLPDGMETGDLLLILVLLLLYLEKEDEEILIILSVLIIMGFK